LYWGHAPETRCHDGCNANTAILMQDRTLVYNYLE
jgi:hypothetical protein